MKTAVAAVLIILAYSFGIVSSAKNVNSYKDLIGYEYGWGLEKAQAFFYQCQISLITADAEEIAEARKIRAREVSFLNSLYSLGFEEPSLEAKKNVEEIYGCDVELRTITPADWKKVWYLTAAELIQWDGFEFFGFDDLLANLKGFSDILKKIEERYQEGIKQDRRQGYTPPHKSSFIESTLREELEKYLPSIFLHLDDINYCLKKVREDGFSEQGMNRETMLYAGALSRMEWRLKEKKGPRAYVELLKQHFPLDSGSFSDWIEIVVSYYVYEWGLTEKEIDEFFAATNENARKAGYWFYVVRKGDTLSNISEFIWGTSKYWPILWEYNKEPGQYYGVRAVTDPKKLKVGQLIALP